MQLLWVQLGGVLVTLMAATLTYRAQRIASHNATSVQMRTVSLEELEKALVFTGNQLSDLRKEVLHQADEIRELQMQYQECERKRLRLEREVMTLRDRRRG